MSAKWPLHPPVKGSRLSSATKRHLQKLADTEVASANNRLAKEKAKAKELHGLYMKIEAKLHKTENELGLAENKVYDLETLVARFEWDIENVHTQRLQELELARGLLGPKGRSDLYDAVKQRKAEIAKAKAEREASATEEE